MSSTDTTTEHRFADRTGRTRSGNLRDHCTCGFATPRSGFYTDTDRAFAAHLAQAEA